MNESKLKTAVLGLNDKGQLLLEAVAGIDCFQIQAVADRDADLAKRIAQKYECKEYDDYRRLIIENQLDVLLVAAPLHCCAPNIQAAMKKKFNILKLAPLARTFEEAVEFVRLAEENDIKFAVANTNRFGGPPAALRQFLREGRMEQISLITVHKIVPAHASTGVNLSPRKRGAGIDNERSGTWRADPKLAGGGVLLHNCYAIIDQLIWNFGTPQQVYSLNTNTAGDRQQRRYLTEDAAVVTMKFTDTIIGNLVASRCIGIGREQELLKVYGKNKILTVSNTRFNVSDHHGQAEKELKYKDDELCCMRKLLENFALSIVLPDKNRICSSSRENLKNMAVIESAYLSARTGMPEEPGRILEMAHVEAVNIWPEHK